MNVTTKTTVTNTVEAGESNLNFKGTYSILDGKITELEVVVELDVDNTQNYQEIGKIVVDGTSSTVKINTGFESYGSQVFGDSIALKSSIENPVSTDITETANIA